MRFESAFAVQFQGGKEDEKIERDNRSCSVDGHASMWRLRMG
jgi:hypothetical protein